MKKKMFTKNVLPKCPSQIVQHMEQAVKVVNCSAGGCIQDNLFYLLS